MKLVFNPQSISIIIQITSSGDFKKANSQLGTAWTSLEPVTFGQDDSLGAAVVNGSTSSTISAEPVVLICSPGGNGERVEM